MKIKHFTVHHFIWCFGFLISIAFIAGSIRYGDPVQPVRSAIEQFDAKLFLRLHIGGGAIWLISGFLQFTPWFQRNLKIHRVNGYICYISALVSSIALISINLTLQTHSLFRTGAVFFAIYSIICLLVSFYHVKKKNIDLHRAWIIRSLLPAVEIPFNRLTAMVLYLYPARLPFDLFILLFIVGEIVISKKANISLLSAKFKKLNVVLMFLYVSVLLLGFGLVFYWQYFLEHKR